MDWGTDQRWGVYSGKVPILPTPYAIFELLINRARQNMHLFRRRAAAPSSPSPLLAWRDGRTGASRENMHILSRLAYEVKNKIGDCRLVDSWTSLDVQRKH